MTAPLDRLSESTAPLSRRSPLGVVLLPDEADRIRAEVERLLAVAGAARYVREHSMQHDEPALNKWSVGPVIVVDPNAWFALADALAALSEQA